MYVHTYVRAAFCAYVQRSPRGRKRASIQKLYLASIGFPSPRRQRLLISLLSPLVSRVLLMCLRGVFLRFHPFSRSAQDLFGTQK